MRFFKTRVESGNEDLARNATRNEIRISTREIGNKLCAKEINSKGNGEVFGNSIRKFGSKFLDRRLGSDRHESFTFYRSGV